MTDQLGSFVLGALVLFAAAQAIDYFRNRNRNRSRAEKQLAAITNLLLILGIGAGLWLGRGETKAASLAWVVGGLVAALLTVEFLKVAYRSAEKKQ